MKAKKTVHYRDYNTGHPWYYYLGGAVLSPKQIRENTKYSQYKGYLREDIAKADRYNEPKRSAALRELQKSCQQHLLADLCVYRQLALKLHHWRQSHDIHTTGSACADIHTNISLKHNHLVNDFAHLIYLDELLSQQGELFGF